MHLNYLSPLHTEDPWHGSVMRRYHHLTVNSLEGLGPVAIRVIQNALEKDDFHPLCRVICVFLIQIFHMWLEVLFQS